MENITNEIIVKCLQFIKDAGGGISRYSFDRYITKNIPIPESFNVVPKKLIDEGFISLSRGEKEIKITLTPLGIERIENLQG